MYRSNPESTVDPLAAPISIPRRFLGTMKASPALGVAERLAWLGLSFIVTPVIWAAFFHAACVFLSDPGSVLLVFASLLFIAGGTIFAIVTYLDDEVRPRWRRWLILLGLHAYLCVVPLVLYGGFLGLRRLGRWIHSGA